MGGYAAGHTDAFRGYPPTAGEGAQREAVVAGAKDCSLRAHGAWDHRRSPCDMDLNARAARVGVVLVSHWRN